METERIIVDKVCKHNPVVKYSLILMNKFPHHLMCLESPGSDIL